MQTLPVYARLGPYKERIHGGRYRLALHALAMGYPLKNLDPRP